MKRLRFSYLVLGVCAALLVYGLIDASGRTAALFVDARQATGFVDASVAFPTTPTTAPATEEPQETTTVVSTSSPEVTRTPERTPSPERTRTPERTPSPEHTPAIVSTVASESTQPSEATPDAGGTATPDADVTSEPDATSESEPTTAAVRTPVAEATDSPGQATPTPPASPSAQPTSAQSPTMAATREPTARATLETESTTEPEPCEAKPAPLTLVDASNDAVPGPFTVQITLSNTSDAPATNVVLGYSVTRGGEYLDEAVFDNGQLWWAHGQPDAAVLYAIPQLAPGQSTTVSLTGTLSPSWTSGAVIEMRVAVVSPPCTTDQSGTTLTLTGAGRTPSAGNAATGAGTPSVTPTPVATTAPIRTVLGINEAPTSGAASATAAALGQTLPETGGGNSGPGANVLLFVGALCLALACFIGGAFVGSRWFSRR